MPPFATLYTFTSLRHAKETKIMAIASLNGLEIAIASDYISGSTNTTPEFLAKFPMGQIPALEVTETGFCLSEGTAICQYLASKGPKKEQLLGRTAEEQSLIQMWVSLGETEIFPNAYGIIVPMMGRDPYVEWMAEKREAALMKALQRVELHLESHEWLVEGSSGANLADLSMAAAMYWCIMFLWDEGIRARYPKTVDWYKRVIEQDEGVKKAFGGEPVFCQQRMPPFPADGKQLM
jgi:elongation factor 1-gamma